MRPGLWRSAPARRAAAGSCLIGAALAAATLATAAPTAFGAAKHSGDVDVISAGSLDTLMTKTVGPAFHKATGYTLVDTSGGSSTDAADIKNKVDVEDVFVSASPAVDTT